MELLTGDLPSGRYQASELTRTYDGS